MSSPRPGISSPLATYAVLICIGYGVDVVAYALLLALGGNVYFAYVASFAVGTVCNVALLRRFFQPGRHGIAKDIAITFASNGAMLVAGVALYAMLMTRLSVPPLFAKLTSNGVTFIVNYCIRRRFF